VLSFSDEKLKQKQMAYNFIFAHQNSNKSENKIILNYMYYVLSSDIKLK